VTDQVPRVPLQVIQSWTHGPDRRGGKPLCQCRAKLGISVCEFRDLFHEDSYLNELDISV
jgi:hypothetical protein